MIMTDHKLWTLRHWLRTKLCTNVADIPLTLVLTVTAFKSQPTRKGEKRKGTATFTVQRVRAGSRLGIPLRY